MVLARCRALEGTDIDSPGREIRDHRGAERVRKIDAAQFVLRAGQAGRRIDRNPGAGRSGELLGRVGYMPQQDMLMPWRTVTDNAAIGLECLGCAREEARRRAREHMARFGLHGFELSYPGQLSGGMRQRVAMLRTFLVREKNQPAGRAFRKARRDHARVDASLAARLLAGEPLYDCVRHA